MIYYQADIGTRYDTAFDETLYGRTIAVFNNLHSTQRVYPTLAPASRITPGTLAWVLGTLVEVIPAGAIVTPFDIHFLNMGYVASQTTYEIHIYSGAIGSEVDICSARFTRNNPFGDAPSVPIAAPIQPANTRISARIASAIVGGSYADISISYNPY